MNGSSLKTDRLTLRAADVSDARFVALALNDLDVSRWLAQVPFPYTTEMAKAWLGAAENQWPDLAVIMHNDTPIGCVDTKDGEFGYWLARSAWGQGFMTEAATAARDDFFQRSDADVLRSGVFEGNAASEGVLRKLGFARTGQSTRHNTAQGDDLPHIDMALTREHWEASQ